MEKEQTLDKINNITERVIGRAIEVHKIFGPGLDRMDPVFEAQLLSYLKFTGKQLGLLINFNVALLKNGIKRIIL